MTTSQLRAVPSAQVPEKGTREFLDYLRHEAQVHAKRWRTSFLDIGRCLHEMHYAIDPVTGKKSHDYYGYPTFPDFVEAELQIPEKTAQRMQRVYFRLEIELCAIPKDIKARLIALKFSSLVDLLSVATVANIEGWVAAAETTTCAQFRGMIVEARRTFAQEQHALLEQFVGESDPFESTPASTLVETFDRDERAIEEKGEEAYTSLPKKMVKHRKAGPQVPSDENKPTYKSFALFPEQMESVDLALKRSQELHQSDSQAYHLSLICDDFVLTNQFGRPGDPETILKYLAKLERHLGLRLTAIDPNTHDVVYGLEALQDAVLAMEERETGDSGDEE